MDDARNSVRDKYSKRSGKSKRNKKSNILKFSLFGRCEKRI